MSRIDLNKNRETLLRAHKEVSDTNNPLNWALFGYEGQTSALTVVEKGDGGFEELIDEMNSGRIQYAYCQVTDPNTNLPKFVLVNWQGEGVPEVKKGSCANHISDVANLLRGAHLTVNARTEDDLDEEEILQKVAKSSGSNYSFHKEAPKPVEAQTGPVKQDVGSVYKRTLPQREIKSNVRDQFWEKQREEEKQRQQDEARRLQQQKSVDDEERKQREAQEEKEREKREAERLKKIRDMKEAERRANAHEKERANVEAQQADALRDAEERSKRSEQLRKQRAAEAKNLIGQRENNPRALFEQRTSQFDEPRKAPPPPRKGPPPPRKIRTDFVPQNQPSSEQNRKQPITLPTEEPEGPPTPIARPAQPPAREEPASPPAAAPPSRPAMQPPAQPPAQPRQPPREPSPEPAPPSQPGAKNLLASALPPRQKDSDDEAEEDDWGEGHVQPDNQPSDSFDGMDDTPSQPTPVRVQEIPQEIYDDAASAQQDQDIYDEATSGAQQEQDIYDEATSGVQQQQDIYDEATSGAQQDIYDDGTSGMGQQGGEELYEEVGNIPGGQVPQAPQGQGQCAIALYDYQADEDNEISFDPDDIITQIEQIDEGWWLGVAPDGNRGMFPANYVQLMD